MAHHRKDRDLRGQTLVELTLVLPFLLMVVFGIIIIGLGVFYQQQIANAAREAARFAAIHSATASCPTTGDWDPASPPRTYPPGGCDRKADGWPFMTAHARDAVFGLVRSEVKVAACWSGYQMTASGARDAPPPGTYDVLGVIDSSFVPCQMDGVDPTQNAGSIRCSDGIPTADEASSMSESSAHVVANTVTTYACYVWRPPLAGFLLIPADVTLRAVATEAIQRQQ